MWFDAFTVVIGGFLIVLLAHLIIQKTVTLAEHWGLSGTFIGMTILSIGTSLPEILTHIVGSVQILRGASMETVSALVVGTNIGSDIFQQQFVLGVVAILGVIVIKRKEIFSMVGGLILGAVLLLIMGLNGIFSRTEGIILVGGYLAYVVYLKVSGLKEKVKAKNHLKRKDIWLAIGMLIGGFLGMAYIANQVLEASRVLIKLLPVSASFFGVMVLGIVAALPELTTALVAMKQHRKGMSAGVLIGSNITNPTFALGLGAIISTYVVPKVVLVYDLPLKIFGALLIFWFFWKNDHLKKWQALVLIAIFVVYLILRQMLFPVDF